ncbi:PRAME family member 12-like [Arvicanthis niloticus]|uniref:PRAME family member 12-like n=1 Tax=Arvicanthis niloticus TaxID=61156 RepID=UPI001486B6D4|nr:PRAME family member 12-like [Arvicanthis niloticus]
MSTYNSPTLEQLALEALLRNDAIDFSDLENLPTMLFPPLLLQAFKSRCTEILKATVVAWPFSYLPVGPLLKTAGVEMMQAVLGGIDILVNQNVHPRKKLQVLDLRDVHQDFWDAWAGREDGGCSADTLRKKQVPESHPTYTPTELLQVVTNLSLIFPLKEDQKCLLQWAQKNSESLQLICLKMKICVSPLEITKEVLDVFQPTYIEELEICSHEVLSNLRLFPHYLDPIRNIIRSNLNQIHFQCNDANTVTDVKRYAAKFFSQFSKLNHLQSLYLNGSHISYDNMKILFRFLKTPLESFSMTFFELSMSDLNHISKCKKLYQLKQLHFNAVVFSESCFKSLRILLENVSETLQSLQFEHCRMEDSQLKVLLPALSQCSQLNSIIFDGNYFSTPVLRDLLQCMANLSNLTVEVYPAPKECYDTRGYIVVESFSQLCPELVQMLMAKRQPKTIMFVTATCPNCWGCCVYDTKTSLCHCWQ